MSHAVIVGNVTGAPELRYTPAGKASLRLGIAENRKYTPAGATEPVEETSFYNVVMWGDLAENVAESIDKGARVVVTGRLQQRSWEQDGVKRSAVEVIADAIGPDLRFATATVARIERRPAAAAA